MSVKDGFKTAWKWFADATWLQYILVFLGIPALVRWIFQPVVVSVVTKMYNLNNLYGQSLEYTHYARGMADFYGRWMFNVIFLIFLAFFLIYLILKERPNLNLWGLHWNRILPGVLFFAVMWAIIYFIFVPIGSLFTGGDTFYLGIPSPPGTSNYDFHSFSGFGMLLQDMFMTKSLWAFAGPESQTVVPGNWTMGILDFLRTWVLNGPILMFLVFGFFFNKLLTMFSSNDITDNSNHSGSRVFSSLFFASLSVPLLFALYRKVDLVLSSPTIEVSGATEAATQYGASQGNLIWLLCFWLLIAVLFNLSFLWAYIEKRKKPLGDWGISLSKWLPGTIVFILGFGISLLAGWHLAPITNGVVQSSGLFGPFESYFGIFLYALICGWIYIRTRNLIATALVYASLPWFFNFILVSPNKSPTLIGFLFAILVVFLLVLGFVESYRFWAPYITFNIVYEKIETPELENPTTENKEE
ncbi:MAG TPA: hypothetical protein PLX04_06445 [Caldisericia bacterium]|nr:hypothetical protein [Caldisericia bacterium]HOU08153.1 hypothetical protein [Caldisericia bacterium]HPL89869.1 hypothetical protein [Caldisericia bacterium]HQG59847.1 hypothetical protein [Caldisericia bacterium]HQH49249.1 hypothetical protein [Caldisericia bacterium]